MDQKLEELRTRAKDAFVPTQEQLDLEAAKLAAVELESARQSAADIQGNLDAANARLGEAQTVFDALNVQPAG